MGNSPSVAPAPVPVPAPAPAPQANMASLPNNSKKNNTKTVIQVPAENVTVSKGGKRRRLHGGVATVQFDLEPRLQLSDAVMEQVTSAPSGALRGGKRRTQKQRKSHKSQKRRSHQKK